MRVSMANGTVTNGTDFHCPVEATLDVIGGKDATARFQKSGSWSQTVFGSTGWPSDEVDFDVPNV